MRRCLLALTTASVVALAGASSAAAHRASAARSCSSFIEVTNRDFSGQHYRFKVKVHDIAASGIGCGGSSYVIRQWDKNLPPGPGIYRQVGAWACRSERPFDGGPSGQSMWYSDCKRGSRRINWTETQLSSTRT